VIWRRKFKLERQEYNPDTPPEEGDYDMLTTTDYHGEVVQVGDYFFPRKGYFGSDTIDGKKYLVVHIDREGVYFFDENGLRRLCRRKHINSDLTPGGHPPLTLGEVSPGDVVFFRTNYSDTKRLLARNPDLDLNRPYMVAGRSEMSTGDTPDLIRLHDFPDYHYSLGPSGGFYEQRFYKEESCNPKEATHVLVLSNSLYREDGLKLGGVYEIDELMVHFYTLPTDPQNPSTNYTYGVRLKGFQIGNGARPYFQGDRFFFFKKEDAQAEKTTTTIMRPEQPEKQPEGKPNDPAVEVPVSLMRLWIADMKVMKEECERLCSAGVPRKVKLLGNLTADDLLAAKAITDDLEALIDAAER
jgi:hypothetical protein